MKVGIVGGGAIAQAHLRAIGRCHGARVVGLADRDPSTRAKTAAAFGITETFSDAGELIRTQRPDVLHILTPTGTHLGLAREALEAGCHCYVEKPIARDAREAEEIAAVAERVGLKVCVGHNFLFDSVVTEARNLVASGKLGAVCGLESYFGIDLGTQPQSRYFKQAYTHWAYGLPGALLQNVLDHPLSLALAFMGEPKHFHALAGRSGVTPEGIAGELRMVLGDGEVTALVTASFEATPRFHFLRILGTHGSLHVDLLTKRTTRFAHRDGVPHSVTRAWMSLGEGAGILSGTAANVLKVLTGRYWVFEGLENLIRVFYESIRSDAPSPVPLRSAVTCMRIMDGVWEQLREQGHDPAAAVSRPVTAAPVAVPARYPKPASAGKALVTGSTGFIGSRLVRRLSAGEGADIRALMRDPARRRMFGDLPVEAAVGNLRDGASLNAAVRGVRVVYHLAAAMAGDWDEQLEETVRGTERLAQAALEHGVERFVHVSSIAVYGIPRLRRGALVDEDTPYAEKGLTPYIRSRIEAERVILRYQREQGLPAVILRPGVVYARGRRISRIGYPLPGGTTWIVIGLRDIELPTVFVDDVVDALALAGGSPLAVGKIYNVVATRGLSQTRYLALLGEHGPTRIRHVKFPYTLATAAGVVARGLGRFWGPAAAVARYLTPFHLESCATELRYDSSRIRKELGWLPDEEVEEHFASDGRYA